MLQGRLLAAEPISPSSPNVQAVQALVRDWEASWEERDFPAYARFYSETFRSPDFRNRESWLRFRKSRLLKPEVIEIELRDYQVVSESPSRVVVQFMQSYRSNFFRDEVTKVQVWVLNKGLWQIEEEYALATKAIQGTARVETDRSEALSSKTPAKDTRNVSSRVTEHPPIKMPQARNAGSGFSFRLESPERSPIPRAIERLRFLVNTIVLDGASHYREGDFHDLFRDVVGKRVQLEDLRKIADAIEARYKQQGFFLSRAYVPPQQVKDGVFKIAVVEGFISRIDVEGGHQELRDFVRERLEPLTLLKPIRLKDIEKSLLLLNDLPSLKASSLLRPGSEAGAVSLVVQIESASAMPGNLSLSNQGSQYVGSQSLQLSQRFLGVATQTDAADLQLAFSNRSSQPMSLSLGYSDLVGPSGAQLSTSLSLSKLTPSHTRVDNIESLSKTFMVVYRHPLATSTDYRLYAESSLRLASSQIRLTDVAFDDQWKAYSIGLQLQNYRTALGLSAGRFTAEMTDVLDHESSAFAPAGEFDLRGRRTQKVSFNLQHLVSIAQDYTLTAALSVQLSDKQLLGADKVSFGGVSFGRGYQPAAATGYQGWGATFELAKTEVKAFAASSTLRYQWLAFIDLARAWQVTEGADHATTLRSVGLGLRSQHTSGLYAEAYWARALNRANPVKLANEISFNLGYAW